MTQEVKHYLDKIEKEVPENYLSFYRFYLKPEVALGGGDEATFQNYQDYGDIRLFALHPYFYPFLSACMKDHDFDARCSYAALTKLRFLLYDVNEWYHDYIPDLEDSYLRDFCEGKVPAGKYADKYNSLSLWAIFTHYQDYGWLYQLGKKKEELSYLEEETLRQLLTDNSWRIDIKYQTTILPKEERKSILERIKKDPYQDIDNCFLYLYDSSHEKVLKSIVCDNEFLDILEEYLLPKKLPSAIVRHILNILSLGVQMKKMRSDLYENFDLLYATIGEEKIKNFDYRRAEKLISLFQTRIEPIKIKKIGSIITPKRDH